MSRPTSSEKARMLAGELYDASDPELAARRHEAQRLCRELAAVGENDAERRTQIIHALFGKPVSVSITPPFFCDYGHNIELGENVYFNFNCVVLDVCRVRIGSNVLFGPAVQLLSASHPMSALERRSGLELGRPVTVEDDVWIGGGAIVCPGVTVGAGSVIGAGSVVTRSLPPGVFAAGSPCRVLRRLDAS